MCAHLEKAETPVGDICGGISHDRLDVLYGGFSNLERYRELSAFGDGVTVVPNCVFLGVVLFLTAELSGKEYRKG